MSDFFIVTSKNKKGEPYKLLIRADWILYAYENGTEGSYIDLSEDNSVSCLESLEDIILMINSEEKVSDAGTVSSDKSEDKGNLKVL